MAELSKTLERRDRSTDEPTRLYIRYHIALVRLVAAATIRERRLFESGVYSRAASISFRTCSCAATIRERRLFGHIRYMRNRGKHLMLALPDYAWNCCI